MAASDLKPGRAAVVSKMKKIPSCGGRVFFKP